MNEININPININLNIEDILVASDENETSQVISGITDSGDQIHILPVINRTIRAWFEFSSNSIEFSVGGEEIELSDFVYQVCHALKYSMIPNRDQFDEFILDGSETLILNRISWEKTLDAWFFQFDILVD